MKKMTSLLFFSALLLTISACANEKLIPLETALAGVMGYGSVDGHFCTSAPSPGKQKLKYLFVIDHSASNKPGFPNPLTPNDLTNTDSTGSRRFGPMINFIRNLVADVNNATYFGLIDFNDQARLGGTTTGFLSDRDAFINQAIKEWIGSGTEAAPSPNDSGFTNYKSALELARQMIRQDAQMEAAMATTPVIASQYVVIFVSDGVPTVATPNSSTTVYTQTYTADIGPSLTNLINIKNDAQLGQFIVSIAVNTAFYFNEQSDPDAISLLQQMADGGNGQFLQFGSGQNVLYQQFAPPSRNITNTLADVFVENENAVWWEDGRLLADTDGDGLPDMTEIQAGSDAKIKDSDGNGVNDYVEYLTKGKPCNDGRCLASARDTYSFCDGYAPVTDSSGAVQFRSSSKDGLNDCEKFVLGGQIGSYSSNGSLIPDELSVKSGLAIVPGSQGLVHADTFGDGVSNYNKIKLGMPIRTSVKQVSHFESRKLTLEVENRPSPQVTCFRLAVSKIALTGTSNTIKVTIVQNGGLLQDKPFIISAERSIDVQSGAVSFSNGDFK